MYRLFAAVSAAFLITACQHENPIPDDQDPPSCQDLHVAQAEEPAAQKVRTVQTVAARGDHALIGGEPADPKQWPASVYARAGSSACSATVVGERALKIAAHCVSNGGTVTFQVGANSYRSTCTHHPSYRSNSTADWAMCLVDKPVTGVAFEHLGVDLKLSVGEEVMLTGYGCIREGGGGGNDGIFRIGKATVQSVPGGTNYDTVTRGGAALCFGDSGGAAYKVFPDGTRKIFGTNSRGDISTMSYLSSTWVATFGDYVRDWAAKNANVKICGVHTDAIGCRGGNAPQPDRKFVVSTKAACVEGAVAPGYEPKKAEIKASVRKSLEQF